jgi:hypothetical protein
MIVVTEGANQSQGAPKLRPRLHPVNWKIALLVTELLGVQV